MQEPTLLYVSDDPETFASHGRLFTGPVADGAVVRLLFDHVNGTGIPIRLVAALVSTGAPGTIALLGGSAGPDGNFMNVGHLATYRFLVAHQAVPGGAVSTHSVDTTGYAIVDFILQPNQCVAGIYDIAATGGPFELRVFACDPGHDTLSIYALLPDLAMSALQRRGIYVLPGSTMAQPLPYSGTPLTVEIGANTATLPRASIDPFPEGAPHKGEYGVIKRFQSTAASPGAFLYVSPRGGGATGTFIVNGQLLQASEMGADTVVKLMSAPSQSIALITMPEINSSYPVQFTLEQNDATIADVGAPGSPVAFA